MGDSRRRQQAARQQLESVNEAAAKAGAALRKLATAASATFGADCLVHADIGRRLLIAQGLNAQLAVGNAAWRVGHGDADVVAHVLQLGGHASPTGQGTPLAFHAWVRVGDILIDFTTYQLRHKASELDALDGQHTTVEWCPDLLVVQLEDVASFDQVRRAPGPGIFHYQQLPQVQAKVTQGMVTDEEDVRNALLIMQNPIVMVFGPNDVKRPQV